MQNRFKFRGKRVGNDEWYYGSYLYLHNPYKYDWTGNKTKTEKDVHFIIAENDVNYAINPKTLGQSTDLKDKNGKLIYENDIVFNNCGRWIIKYCDKCKSYQCFDNTFGCFACLGDYNWFEFIDNLNDTVVKGNIYENSELLEDGKYE